MDQNTYNQRLLYYTQLINPSNERILEFAQSLSSNKNNLDSSTRKRLSLIVNSSLHPQTKDPIFKPFRMCSFVPTNLLVTVGLVLPNPSVKTLLFWHWMNQSVNVCVNFSNANKSGDSSIKEVAKAYVSAVVVSISLALGLTRLNDKYNSKPKNVFSLLVNKSVPFVSVASASVVNVVLMRYKELNEGVNVYTEQNELIGASKEAGKTAVFQVAISRITTLLPSLLLVLSLIYETPIIMGKIENNKAFCKKYPRLLLPIRAALIGSLLYVGLPLALAIYPQTGMLTETQAEKDFPGFSKRLYFNKGL